MARAGLNSDVPVPSGGAIHALRVVDLSDEVRVSLLTDGRDDYVRHVLAGLKTGARGAIREFGLLVREAGKARDFALELQRALGGIPVSEARSSVDMVRRVRDASPDDMAREALGYLDKLAAERGQTRAALIASLAVEGP